jgi:lipopolysaccharide transport system permease protein
VTNPHRPHPTSPASLVASLWSNRALIRQLVVREVLGRYRGSLLGLAWSFLNPLLMLAIYTFVFSVVFKARWGISADEGKLDFALVLFVGLIVHGLFAECATRAPTLVLAHVNYVKKVVFPLEVLPVVTIGSALFHAGASALILLGAILASRHAIACSAAWLPVVLLPLALGTLGVSWLLASLGVYLRDVAQLMNLVVAAMLFVSPVFFSISALPPQFRPLVEANPLSFVIEQARQVVIWSRPPDWSGLAVYSAGSLLVLWLGYWWFQKTRKGFADVL